MFFECCLYKLIQIDINVCTWLIHIDINDSMGFAGLLISMRLWGQCIDINMHQYAWAHKVQRLGRAIATRSTWLRGVWAQHAHEASMGQQVAFAYSKCRVGVWGRGEWRLAGPASFAAGPKFAWRPRDTRCAARCAWQRWECMHALTRHAQLRQAPSFSVRVSYIDTDGLQQPLEAPSTCEGAVRFEQATAAPPRSCIGRARPHAAMDSRAH